MQYLNLSEMFSSSNCSLKKMSPSALCKDILIFSSHTLYTTNFLQKSSDWCIACYRRFFTSLTDRRTAGHWVCLRPDGLHHWSNLSQMIPLKYSLGWEVSITLTELCYMIANILWWILNCLNQGLLITFFSLFQYIAWYTKSL